MKKVLFFAMGLASVAALAQSSGTPNSEALKGRIGINIESPRATMDIVGRPITDADKNFSRGVILPHISEAQKLQFTDQTEGLMIWNTTKKCIDYWDSEKWQCLGEVVNTPPATTYTGRAIWGDDANESISATKNCPTGQRGSTITYPVNASQRITYTATSTISQADANQKAIDLMNSSAKQQERQTLAQNYANANGTCTQSLLERMAHCSEPDFKFWPEYLYVFYGNRREDYSTGNGNISLLNNLTISKSSISNYFADKSPHLITKFEWWTNTMNELEWSCVLE